MQIKGIKVEWTQTFEHHCIRTRLGIYSLLLIHSKIEYFTFAFVISKKEKIYKIYISLYF